MNDYKRLQDIFNKHGVCSNEFYKASKNLITYFIHKNLHGYKYQPEFFNECYKELILAVNGGYTTHYNKVVYKEPIYKSNKNIGLFIAKIVRGALSKYFNKIYRKDYLYCNKYISVEDIILHKDFHLRQGGVLCA